MDTMLGMFGPALSEAGARFYLDQYGGRIELGRISIVYHPHVIYSQPDS